MSDEELILRRKKQNADRARAYRKRQKDLEKVLHQRQLNAERCRRYRQKCKQLKSQDPAEIKNEIKVFCPKCGTEVSHTAQGIKEDQTKIFIAKTYHYFEQEYEELKAMYGDLDLTPLSKFCQRTALATGVSEQTVLQILKEEETRNAENSERHILSRASESSMHTDSFSDEDSLDDNDSESSNFNEPQTLVVKVEPEDYNIVEPEIHLPTAVKQELSDSEVKTDEPGIQFPITVKQELSDSEVRTDEPEICFWTAVKQEPSGSEVKTFREQPLTGPISLDVKTEPRIDILDESSLLGEVEVKVENTERGEERLS